MNNSLSTQEYQSLSAQIAELNKTLNQQRPPPILTNNPHRPQISLSFNQPNRGMNCLVQDIQGARAIVSRVKEVAVGIQIDAKLRGVIKSMNTETNKDLCKKLEGTSI